MKLVLTGGTGFIGSAVLTKSIAAGHDVTAVVRSEESAGTVSAAGATALVGDLFDSAWLAGVLADHDGAIHTAAASDARDAELNDSVITAATTAFGGTGKPFVHTGGIWTYGDSTAISETDAPNPPAITAWRIPEESRVVAADFRGSVVQPGIVYGHGKVLPTLLIGGPRDQSGVLMLIGTGEQHWTTVHVDELADLYVLVLESDAPGLYAGANGTNPTVRELGEAIVAGGGATGIVPGSADEAAERFGPLFAEALLLDQQADGAKAKSLGWKPSAPSLADLLSQGYPA